MKRYKWLFYFYYGTILISLAINCFNSCNFYIYSGAVLALAGLALFLIPKEIREEMPTGDMILEVYCFIIPMMVGIPDLLISRKFERYNLNNGPSMVKKCKVEKVYKVQSGSLIMWKSDIVATINNDTIRKGTINIPAKRAGGSILCYWNICCPSIKDYIDYYMVKDYSDFELINDFGFVEKEQLYSYHDYSLMKPGLVYYNAGFSIAYKAAKEKVSDSIINLCFKEINGASKKVSFKHASDSASVDTFLVFRNINENFDDGWHVCAQEINSPENWAKISDYGYIFHLGVYSREEIEGQCPEIRNYAEKYRERITGNQSADKKRQSQ